MLRRCLDAGKYGRTSGVLSCLKILVFLQAGHLHLVYSHSVVQLLVGYKILYDLLELVCFDISVIQPLKVWQMVEGVSGIVAKTADRVWRIRWVTKRESVQMWQ